jgi:hypothetical protein
MTLARDATSSGDPVLAENYLQHAEHYNRIIMAFRDQNMAQGGEAMNGGGRHRSFMGPDGMEPSDEFSDDDGDDGDAQLPMRQHEPQPRIEGQRFEGPRGGHEQNRFRDRSDRHGRHGGGEQRGFQSPRQHSAEAPTETPSHQPAPEGRRRESFAQTHEQPEFLRRPVRRPRREGNGTPSETTGVAEETEQD